MIANINFKSDILPHLIAVVVFAVVSVVFYAPAAFESKQIYQHDILQGAGSNQELIEFREESGEEGLWTNSMFSGMPAYLINVRWSGDLLLGVNRALTIGLGQPMRHTFLACICFYVLLIVYGVRPALAIAGGLAYGLSSFQIISIEVGHIWKVLAMAYMPMVLAGVYLMFKEKWKWGFLLTALGMGLEIRSNHLQITYYLALTLGIMGISWLIYLLKEKQQNVLPKTALLLVGAVLLGVACNFGKLWATYEYGNYSTRGKSELTTTIAQGEETGLDREYVFRWSYGIGETFTLLIPNFYGGASSEKLNENSTLGEALRGRGAQRAQIRQLVQNANTYWGDQPFTAGPTYVGAIICFFFVLGLILVDARHKWWMLGAVILSFMLSWGKNFEAFNYLMYDIFPGYNKFRSVTMSISIALLIMPLLGFLGVEKFLQNGWSKTQQKHLLIAFGVVGGLALFFAVFAGMFSFRGAIDARLAQAYPDWFIDALRDQRQSMMRGDAFRSFIFILLAAVTLFFTANGKLKEWIGTAVIVLLVLVDLWPVDARYLTADDYQRDPKRRYFQTNEADDRILRDTDPHYRVLNLSNPFNEARTSYHHKSIGGYHGAKMKRYQELVSYCVDGEIQSIISSNGNTIDTRVVNMLNTKYLIAGNTAGSVITNPSAFGNAWFVDEVVTVENADDELSQTCERNLFRVAVVDQSKFPIDGQSFGKGTIDLMAYKPNYLKYQASINSPGLAVFSEVYYPKGWVAKIDGEVVDYIRANYVLRALEVPAGEHTIEFEFVPAAYRVGNTIMMIASLILILLTIAGIVLDFRPLLAKKAQS